MSFWGCGGSNGGCDGGSDEGSDICVSMGCSEFSSVLRAECMVLLLIVCFWFMSMLRFFFLLF